MTQVPPTNLENFPTLTGNEDRSAIATLQATLDSWGLGSLANWLWNEHIQNVPDTQIFLDLQQTPEFKQRFPAMDFLAKQGKAITPQQYVDYEKSVTEKMRAAGLPAGFYDTPDDFTQFIKNDVSVDEVQSRIDMARVAVYNSAPEDLAALEQYYGIQGGTNHIGDATAYFLDESRALPVIQNQFQAARDAGMAARSGFNINQTQAEYLNSLGVTDAQAQQGFGKLGQLAPLFQALPGEGPGTPSTQQGLQAVFANSGEAQAALEAEGKRRRAQFQQGGQFTETQKGTGVGSA